MVAVAGRDGVRVRPQSIDEIRDLLSWREGLLVFRGTPLVEAVAELHRYNAHKLVGDDPSIAAIPVGGSFRWATTHAFVRLPDPVYGMPSVCDGAEIGRLAGADRGVWSCEIL